MRAQLLDNPLSLPSPLLAFVPVPALRKWSPVDASVVGTVVDCFERKRYSSHKNVNYFVGTIRASEPNLLLTGGARAKYVIFVAIGPLADVVEKYKLKKDDVIQVGSFSHKRCDGLTMTCFLDQSSWISKSDAGYQNFAKDLHNLMLADGETVAEINKWKLKLRVGEGDHVAEVQAIIAHYAGLRAAGNLPVWVDDAI